MKSLLLSLLSFISLGALAQESKAIQETPNFSYKCTDSTKFSKDKKVIQLFGDASFKTNALEILHADNIMFDSKTNELTVTGKFDFLTHGALIVKDASKGKTLTYRIGDDTVYIN